MRYSIADLVEQLWLKHTQMLLRLATPRAALVQNVAEEHETKPPVQVAPYKPVEDHRLRASNM